MQIGVPKETATASVREQDGSSSSAMTEDATIIGGTGALGSGLALRLIQSGASVVIGSRDEVRAREAAARLKSSVADGRVAGAENLVGVRRAPIVILCVPFRNQLDNLMSLRDVLEPGQIVVDATVPLAVAVSGKATRLLGVPQGSAGEQAAEVVPDGVSIVSALHTVSAAKLNSLDDELAEDVFLAGDSAKAKRQVAMLIARIPGLRPVNAGRLEAAKLIESLTPLLIGLNSRYKTHAGIRITGLGEDLW